MQIPQGFNTSMIIEEYGQGLSKLLVEEQTCLIWEIDMEFHSLIQSMLPILNILF